MHLIYVSGIDGCGKTTQSKILVDKLKKCGWKVTYKWLRWEPSFVKLIDPMRKIVIRKKANQHKNNPNLNDAQYIKWIDFKSKLLSYSIIRKSWLFFASFDYYLSIYKQINNQKSQIIVADRYKDDFLIDQASNFGLSPKKLCKLSNNRFLRKLPDPDMKIIIDIPAIEAINRKQDDTPLIYLDNRVAYYQTIGSHDNSFTVQGLKDCKSLSNEIFCLVNGRLSNA